MNLWRFLANTFLSSESAALLLTVLMSGAMWQKMNLNNEKNIFDFVVLKGLWSRFVLTLQF